MRIFTTKLAKNSDEIATEEIKTDEFPLEFHKKYEVLKELGKVDMSKLID